MIICTYVLLLPLSLSAILSFFLSVSGLGYGIISGLFAMVNVLADITGPGSLGLQGDPQNFLIVSGELYITSLSCANFSVSLA